MLFRKTWDRSATGAVLGCLLGVAIAAVAIAAEDNDASPSRPQLNKQSQQLQQAIDRQRMNDEHHNRRSNDSQPTEQPNGERTIELQGDGRQASEKSAVGAMC